MIDAGIHGLIMLGTVGENCSLEYSEKLELLKATVAHVAGRVPVLSGVAECTTALACRFARDAQRVGVMGLMVLPAMVYKSDPRETLTHFRTVAAASDLPIMVYNNPVSYHVDITPEMFAELADEPKFVAIKESSENVRRITDLKIGRMTASQLKRVQVIDSHTGGEPTRVVIAGGPELGDGTMAERMAVFRDRHDSFRSAVVNEPRGSDVMVGALLCQPVDPSCAAGVIFFNNSEGQDGTAVADQPHDCTSDPISRFGSTPCSRSVASLIEPSRLARRRPSGVTARGTWPNRGGVQPRAR